MAPSRRRGTKGSGGAPKTELSLGDLVLAKVKGFPAWPAKISRPEDWDRAPDPRKYFVQFFGTLEIAFVAPADIQTFTIEVKNKLSGRGRGKTQFAQAVKEICEAFDQLQEKNSVGPRDDDNDPELGTAALSADGLVDDAVKGNRTDPIGNDGEYQSSVFKGSGLESCSLRQGETECQDMKPCSSSGVDGGTSPTKPTKKGSKFSNNGAKTVKEDVMPAISPCSQSFQKESVSHCGSLNNNESVHFHAAEVGCSPLESSDHSEDRDDVQKDLTNGHRPRLASGSKRRFDGSNEMHHSNINRPASTRPFGAHVPVKFGSGAKDLAQNDFRLGLGSDSEKRPKKLLKGKKNFELGEKPRVDSKESFKESKGEFSSKKQGHGKTNEHSHPAKRSKHVNMEDDTPKALLQTSRKLDSQSHGDKLQSAEVKSNLLVGKAESRSSTKPLSTTSDSTLGGDEDILPPAKRRRRAMEAMSGSSALGSENRIGKSSVGHKNDMSRRRAVRLCDDDEDEEPKTPIHGGSAKKSFAPLHGQASTKRADNDPLGKKDSVTLDDISLKKLLPSVDRPNESSSPFPQQNEEKQQFKTAASRTSFSPGKVDSEKVSSKDAKLVPLSPKRSPNAASKAVSDSLKANKHVSKVPGSNTLKKAVSSSKFAGATSDNLSSDNQPPSDRSKLGFSGERNKDPTLMAGNLMDIHFLPGERSQTGKDDKLSSIDQKVLDSATSMRHLIAAAQAKRRQAHLQNFNGNSGSHIDVQVMSPSPTSVAQPLASSNMQLDAQGIVSHSSITSPPDVHQNSSFNQHDNEEFVERRVSSGHHAAGGSLSGGTEAAVARDAFEGMIETLSRTKESIGRATRLAIDCAKYGIANEVVELLIRKLENEPSFHRKVDLFFLVDSITQCSHSHKGIAGASYIPAVQAALPRLLGAAAPSGSGARENRRQCLKVLRLWLERKILPESLIRRYMDDIGGLNDDSSGFSLRRPSRAERAIDDPIREMEGMLVDEYGSNATFQLPGFFASHAFHEDDEEEDDFPDCSSKGVLDISPSEHTPLTGDPENHTVTANERRHHILEDVDGELEMEDVSGHQKDERTPFIADANSGSIKSCESETVQLPPIPEGSPPPPLDSPPTTPPLPSSQPPSPPAHPPPPPPPLPTSPSPPPPPPPLMLQPHLVHSLPIAPTMLPPPPPPPLPPQPSLVPQHMHSLPSSNLSSSVLAYQPAPVAQEIGGNPSGNPHPPLAGSASHGPSADTSARNEVFPQQAPCFVPIGVGSAREPSGYNSSRPLEYGHNDTYINPQASQPSQQFQPGNVPFAQRPLPPNPPPQNTSSHFSYPATAIRHQTAPQIQHHPPHLYPSPYSVPNFADGPRPFVPDERWRMQPNEFNADHQRAMWMPGVRSCSGPVYVQDGYFRPPSERPSAGASGFRPPAANPLPGGASVPGHGVSHMIPSRPDMSAISWRPA